jgi:omega-6 fatty acid desaturase (delta-12 desaturase)
MVREPNAKDFCASRRMLEPADTLTAVPGVAGLHDVVTRFQRAIPRIAGRQIANTILPLIALVVAMHVGIAFGCWPLLALGIPAAALTVRTFIIQHDCGHGSFFPRRSLNDLLGQFCSLLTLTPYTHWRRHHSKHHSAWNDLDRRGCRDIYSSCLTVDEYNALSTWRRLLYRLAKHPAISLLVLPPLIFLIAYRFPFSAPPTWRSERRSVHLTNLSLVALHGGLAVALGFGAVSAVLLAVIVPASIVGVWLFSLQHVFDRTHWARHAQWNPIDAALRGSSFLRLPRLLQWVTGNIGFHHVHHAAPRVPNYRLEACHGAHPGFAAASVLTLTDALRGSRYALWDELHGRMVSIAEAARRGK